MNGTVVIIPAFNEARTIAAVLSSVFAEGPQRVIVIDDGSADATAAVVQDLIDAAGGHGVLELIRHPLNLGKGFALASGIARALVVGAQRIVSIDADGQHDGADLRRLERVAALHPMAVVIASRTRDRARAPALRRFANAVADFWISWACGRRVDDTQSGYRLYPAQLLACVGTRPRRGRGFAFETELLIDCVDAGADVLCVPISTRYAAQGRASHYRPWRDTWSIVRLVGGRLIGRGMYPRGLLRALAQKRTLDRGGRLSLLDGD